MTKQGEKILLVDDDPLVRAMLSDVLESNNYVTEAVKNGAEALKEFKPDSSFDLMITDLNMPEMGGLELIQELRRLNIDVPIIVLTVVHEVTSAINALKNGASDYLFKDENIQNNILHSIRNLLEKQRLKKQNEKLLLDLTKANSELETLTNKLEDVVDKLTNIGIGLSSETNLQKLLETIVSEALDITNADAGTLYILKDNQLHFKIVQNKSKNIFLGGASKNQITFPPVPLTESNISAYCALKKEAINIPDIDQFKNFDVSDLKEIDAKRSYLTKSMLIIPMLNQDNEVMGVLELVNALHPDTCEIVEFSQHDINVVKSLASQASVSITNAKLYEEMKKLFESFAEALATAIDEKSPTTRGHIAKVSSLTLAIANEINKAGDGYFKEICFSEDELNELKIASLLHDVGKVTTPESVMNKKTKLETIFDRIELIEVRFSYIKNELTVEALQKKCRSIERGDPSKAIEAIDQSLEKQLRELDADICFIQKANEPEELMDNQKLEQLKIIASKILLVHEKKFPLLTKDELHNLSIKRGSITAEEMKIMQNHAAVTVKILNKMSFIEKLKNVPVYAGGHHENLDGTGYPLGLKGDQIPLQTRIVALSDLFEALTSKDRPYKKPIPVKEALEIIKSKVQDNQIDPNLFDFFKKRKIYEKI